MRAIELIQPARFALREMSDPTGEEQVRSSRAHFKTNSSRWINKNQKVPTRFEWQRGYGAFSVSESMSETVKSYIESKNLGLKSQAITCCSSGTK